MVAHVAEVFDQALHGSFIHVHMHVAKVEYGEAVEKRWQLLEHNIIALDENASCISASAPVETGQLKCISNDRMHRIPVLYVTVNQHPPTALPLLSRPTTHSL